MTLLTIVRQPWPWYVAGPIIGLIVPALLLVGNKSFGISSNLRHICAAALPGRVRFFQYDWRDAGGWNLAFALGIGIGAALAMRWLVGSDSIAIAPSTRASLAALGIRDFSGLAPHELFTWHALATWRGALLLVGGGFLVGFGTAYAGGCTSGHAIAGLADLQLPSLVAVVGFFAGGLLTTWIILPKLLGGW
ncbi:MAG: YeeE/YedE thiosulfate transporter family protein [bacterium]